MLAWSPWRLIGPEAAPALEDQPGTLHTWPATASQKRASIALLRGSVCSHWPGCAAWQVNELCVTVQVEDAPREVFTIMTPGEKRDTDAC